MIKVIGLSFMYAVGVALLMNHFFSTDSSDMINSINNSPKDLATIMFSLPGVWFLMDYFQNRDNSHE